VKEKKSSARSERVAKRGKKKASEDDE